uniref:serine/arginine repetitive matrix protein 1-like n=1 Tax=Odobenus rosmarus divergens TaxID=9708 RepID=UPI00063CCE60|nr:PREDICTED: serine/arginine repetitive matrix protein 1-like [Odobenus rosmarus divergens]
MARSLGRGRTYTWALPCSLAASGSILLGERRLGSQKYQEPEPRPAAVRLPEPEPETPDPRPAPRGRRTVHHTDGPACEARSRRERRRGDPRRETPPPRPARRPAPPGPPPLWETPPSPAPGPPPGDPLRRARGPAHAHRKTTGPRMHRGRETGARARGGAGPAGSCSFGRSARVKVPVPEFLRLTTHFSPRTAFRRRGSPRIYPSSAKAPPPRLRHPQLVRPSRAKTVVTERAALPLPIPVRWAWFPAETIPQQRGPRTRFRAPPCPFGRP